MLDNNMTLFRDMFPNKIWEPSKGTYNYTDQRLVNCFQRLKTMQDRGIKTSLGIWDVPYWMVSNPSSGGGFPCIIGVGTGIYIVRLTRGTEHITKTIVKN